MAEKIMCPACGKRTAEGAFCEQCGHDMAARAAEAVQEPVIEGTALPSPARASPEPSTGGSPEAGPGTPEPAPRTVVFCQDLKVEYNMAAIFVVGISMPFGFRITPLVDGLEHIVVSIDAEVDDRELHLMKRLKQRPLKGKPFVHSHNFRPKEGFGGVISFEVRVCYERDGCIHSFETSTRHKVYPQQSNAREVMDTIIVNINNEINTGHAADISLRNDLDKLQSLRDRTSEQATLQNLVNQFFDIPEALCSLPIYPANWLPPEAGGRTDGKDGGDGEPPENARLDRVTLRDGERLVHLLADERLSLGRSRDNDLVTRNFIRAGIAPREINRRISRYHCRLELHGDRCFVVDGGFDPEAGTARASASGTYLDGVQLVAAGSVETPAGSTSLLTLAGRDPEQQGVMALRVRTIPCSRTRDAQCAMSSDCEEGMVSGVYLERAREDAPESYVLLARCADLGDLIPALRGMVVWRRDGGIMYSTGRTRGWLATGDELTVNGRRIAVEPYRQWGL